MTNQSPAQNGTQSLFRREQWHAVSASFLGWTLDAFDFFSVVFIVDRLAAEFSVSKADIIWTLTATLAMRPVGALVFGLFADRYGRRTALMANVIFYSVLELLCGFSQDYIMFLILRTLFGIGMGGEWGVGASLAMESVPKRWRGLFSGILQSGYSVGYLLAALSLRFILPAWGWRAMFWAGGAPALLALYVRMRVPETEAWQVHRVRSTRAILGTVAQHWKSFLYLVGLMTLMMFLSHGTQDLYPDFLKSAHHLSSSAVSSLAILYNVGAIIGAVIFGQLSERLGRRRGMTLALVLSLVVIPLWALGGTVAELALGAFLMQMGVQGAWGIIPAHLNELAPASARSLLPGLAYQLGILIAAPTNTLEYILRDRVGYGWALAGFEVCVIVLGIVAINLGRERRGHDFVKGLDPNSG
ncbi:MAG TPA: MFS transporter [Terriglobia bacterium]|nr:MFS transporter [Terriglobia bacterium]HEX5481788.1 MFS transporter [Terriglobia bacterium]